MEAGLNTEEIIAELMKYGHEIPSQDAMARLAKASGKAVAEIEALYASVAQGVRLVEATKRRREADSNFGIAGEQTPP